MRAIRLPPVFLLIFEVIFMDEINRKTGKLKKKKRKGKELRK